VHLVLASLVSRIDGRHGVPRNPRIFVVRGTYHVYCRVARGERQVAGRAATIGGMGYLVPIGSYFGCAIVISHDRSLPDRIATRILAFEGDSKVTFFDGNFSEYEDGRRQTLGDAATRPHRITYRKLTR
jgi:hypothetical protein